MFRKLIPLPILAIVLAAATLVALSNGGSVHATDQFPTKRPLQDAQPEADANFGNQVVVGDINGDGIKDIVVGASGASVGGVAGIGKVVVLLGPCFLKTVTFTVAGLEPNAGFGTALATGDVNGDGIDDVVVGAPTADVGSAGNAGKAFVFYGAPQGSLADKTAADKTLQDPTPEGNARFGYSVAVGNVGTNANSETDTNNDVIVGAPWKTLVIGSSTMPNSGWVRIFWGTGLTNYSTLYAPRGTNSTNNYFGWSLAVGRFDGSHQPTNAYVDLLVGATGASTGGFQMAGEVDFYKGQKSFGSRSYADSTIISPLPAQGATFGWSIALGKLNDDSFDDAIVGAPDNSYYLHTGKAYVVEGRASPPSLINDGHTIPAPSNPSSWRYFGRSVASGNVDNDQYDDIVVSGPFDRSGSPGFVGIVYVWRGGNLGPPGSPLGAPDFTLQDPVPGQGESLGWGGVAVANLDQGPGGDVVAGAHGYATGGVSGAGKVMLFGTESDTDSDALNDSCDNCPTVANGPYDPPPYGKQANSDSIPLTFTGWSNADLDHGAATVYTDHTIPTSGLATHPLGSDWKTWDDWQGDACQDDADRDGLTNTQETSGSACNGFTSNPQLMNSNQGGDPTKPINLDIDGWECRSTVPKDVTSPTDTAYPPQGMTDSDGDGIPDILEMQKYGTDPNNADTDGDGLSDGVEIFDVTGNGVVDGADGWSVCAAMHGKIQYSVNLDLDKNGVINSVDMQWMNTRLGANAVNCPP